MPDRKKFAMAYAQLDALRRNIPSFLDESRVNDYHSIVDALQDSSGDDLSCFRIGSQEMNPKVISARRGGYGGGPGHVTYSDKKYCDRGVFARQVEALWLYIQSAKADMDSNARLSVEFEGPSTSHERVFQRLAIEEARKSKSESDGKPRPKVGAVVVKDGRLLGTAFRGEIPKCHAEYILLERKLKDAALAGATVYTTLEPCTKRNAPKEPCVNWLTARNVERVVIGMLDPNISILGKGIRRLRKAGIKVELFEPDLMAEVEELNREFAEHCDRQESASNAASEPSVTVERSDTRAEGMKWVEETVARLLKERGMTLDAPLNWTPDLDRGMFTMEAKMEGHSKVHRLSYEALEDSVADTNVQRAIEQTLRTFFLPEIPSRRGGIMEEPHNQVVTTYPVAIKSGQQRVHVPMPIPWHAKSETVQCSECETVFIATEGFPKTRLLESLHKQHERGQGHPDYIASEPEWTHVSECDCGR